MVFMKRIGCLFFVFLFLSSWSLWISDGIVAMVKQSDASQASSKSSDSSDSDGDEDDGDDDKHADCRSARDGFNQSYSQFTQSCSQAGMGRDCFRHLQRCRECQSMSLSKDEDEDENTSNVPDFLEDFRRTCIEDDNDEVDLVHFHEFDLTDLASSLSGSNNNQNAINRFRNCPALASEGLGDRREELEAQQEKVDNMEKSLAEQAEELSALKNEFGAQKAQKQQDMDEIKTKFEDGIAQLKENHQKWKGEVSNEMLNLEGEIQKSIEADREIVLKEGEVRDAYRQELLQLQSECHNVALQRSSERRQAILQARSQGMHQVSTATQAFRQAGFSSEKQSQKFMAQFTQSCHKDPNMKRSRLIAKQKRDQALARLSTLRLNNEELRQRLSQQIQSKKSQLLPQEKVLMEKLQQLYERTRVALTQQQKNFSRMTEDFSERIRIKEQLLLRAQQRLREEQETLQQRRQYVTAAQQHSQGSTTERGSVSKAMGAIEETKAKAISAINTCDCCGANRHSSCSAFKNFVSGYYNLNSSSSGSVNICGTDDHRAESIREGIGIDHPPPSEGSETAEEE